MSRRARLAGWALVVVLAAAAGLLPRPRPPEPPSVFLRLLGPVASLAASAQWLRVDAAMRVSRTDLALARAETALALDPGATGGWLFLARHLAFDLASPEREPSPGRRLAWIRAGLDLAARGEPAAREPAELALWQGLVRGKVAWSEDAALWPGGERALWAEAARDFERADRLGHPGAAELAKAARRRLED